jgi:sugar O-acyltransferase (sialic acid O-acetyltransferase NeuD family)
MEKIAIFGAGGFGREVACLINSINEHEKQWDLIGFFDDNRELFGQPISHFGNCLGGLEALNSYPEKLAVVVAIGNSSVVKNIVEQISNPNIFFPNLIHPNFSVVDPESFKIGKGNIIQKNCSVSCNVSIGDFNLFNGSVIFGHDDMIGNFNTFMPASRISGEVTIGDLNFFGVGSIILQQIKIGNHVRLGAGSVLMRKPKDGFLYLGVPAKKMVI